MHLPTSTKLNGKVVDWSLLKEVQLPFVPGWHFKFFTHGDLSLYEFSVMGGSRPVHRAVINGNRDLMAPAVKLVHDDEFDPLGPLEGHLWSDPEALNFLAPARSNPYDWHFDEDAPTADVKITKATGSSGIERFLSEALVCLEHGASPAAYSWFAAYAKIQYRRPRQITENGLPAGLDGQKVERVEGFSEWYTVDKEGEHNPGDAQHCDVDELYWGWRLFKDPMFLMALIQAWMTFRWQFETWLEPLKTNEPYVGSARTPGLMLKATAMLIDALRGVPAFASLRTQAIEFAMTHLGILETVWPIYTQSGSVSLDMRHTDGTVKKHTKPWMDSILALGLQYLWAALVRAYSKENQNTDRCLILAEKILDWIDSECWDSKNKWLATEVAKDGTKHWQPLALGTTLWPSSALHLSPKDRQVEKDMLAYFNAIGAFDDSSKYRFSWGIGSIPKALGYSTGFEAQGFPSQKT